MTRLFTMRANDLHSKGITLDTYTEVSVYTDDYADGYARIMTLCSKVFPEGTRISYGVNVGERPQGGKYICTDCKSFIGGPLPATEAEFDAANGVV